MLGKSSRVVSIIGLLQSGRPLNARQIAAACGVTRRTVFRDLIALQEAGIHPTYDPARQSYSLPANQIPGGSLTTEDVVGMAMATTVPLPMAGAARRLLAKIAANLSQSQQQAVERLHAVTFKSPTLNAETYKNFDIVLNSLLLRTCVRLRYHGADGSIEQTKFSPYALVQRFSYWHCIGRSSLHRSVRAFGLHNLTNAEPLDESYLPPPRFSAGRWLGDAWAVDSNRSETQQVTVRFTGEDARKVGCMHWHPGERMIVEQGGTLTYSVRVNGLDEIADWVMSFGPGAEVIEPLELRTALHQRANALVAMYTPKAEPDARPTVRPRRDSQVDSHHDERSNPAPQSVPPERGDSAHR